MHSMTSVSGKTIAVHALAIAIAAAALCGSGRQPSVRCGTIVGDRWVHLVSTNESWTTIGARVGVDPTVLAARNGLTVRFPLKPGDVLGIDNRHIVPAYEEDGLLINVSQRMLFHVSQGVVRAHYPVAVGRPDWQTPLGPFSIVAMETDPTWDVPLSIQEEMRRAGKPVVTTVPPGPDNPLGRYWMELSLGSIGLHGTTTPSNIYHFATHGCIRLHPDDVEDLFDRVAEGEHGRIVLRAACSSHSMALTCISRSIPIRTAGRQTCSGARWSFWIESGLRGARRSDRCHARCARWRRRGDARHDSPLAAEEPVFTAASHSIEGHVSRGFDSVRKAFADNFARRRELGGACCAYRGGEKVVDLWGGIRNKQTGEPWEQNTMVIVHSATKGLAAMTLALAHSRGWLDYEERVCTYWPEFAQQGKEQNHRPPASGTPGRAIRYRRARRSQRGRRLRSPGSRTGPSETRVGARNAAGLPRHHPRVLRGRAAAPGRSATSQSRTVLSGRDRHAARSGGLHPAAGGDPELPLGHAFAAEPAPYADWIPLSVLTLEAMNRHSNIHRALMTNPSSA